MFFEGILAGVRGKKMAPSRFGEVFCHGHIVAGAFTVVPSAQAGEARERKWGGNQEL